MFKIYYKHVNKCLHFKPIYFSKPVSKSYTSGPPADETNFDLVVIGGGSGGLSCAKEAASLGKKVAVLDYVEPSSHGTKWGLGGTCVNVGCIPKKLCHHAAQVGGVISYANKFGWKVPEKVPHDWELMIKNITNYIRSLNFKHRVKLVEMKVKYINAKGHLLDPHTIKATARSGDNVTETQIKAANIVIATGKRPRIPNIPGVSLCITSDDLFWKKTPPGKTLCIGAGYVALEAAGFIQGLGYETTVMARSVPLSKFDKQMAKLVTESMERHGTKVLVNTMPEKFEKSGSRIKVTWRSSDSGLNSDIFDTVVMAIGRTASPNLQIGLQQAGVTLDVDGCVVGNFQNEREKSSVPHIYAIGDALQNGVELTPVAARAGKLLARRMFGFGKEQMDYNNIATTVFTPLEYGCVGMSEELAVATYGEENVDVYHAFYKPLEYTVAENTVDDKGCYIKVIVKRQQEERVLGIHFTGPHAGEVIQGFAVAFRCVVTFQKLVSTVGIHPTVAEEFTKLHITKRSGLDATVTGC
ncbi:hypothetical protein HELRODRAFT_188524 [Helobdella robusta]|uniref:Thioredoxin-disulfide reductase n=1 Tax=Helobdella robusta TaxID=6412 RepID=T1FQ32_HELRO|nr:hypothetical protein HELRODRAFT_188524 [Helobdella robusta]ESO01919.1 hypothetical protein HELRODRAFT_188524 [Helobdella robusta]